MEIKDYNNQRIKAEDIPNAFNKHFIEMRQNLSQQIPISNFSPDYYIDQINENFTFREINEQEVLTLLLGLSTSIKQLALIIYRQNLMKLAASLIVSSLTKIFNESITTELACSHMIGKYLE